VWQHLLDEYERLRESDNIKGASSSSGSSGTAPFRESGAAAAAAEYMDVVKMLSVFQAAEDLATQTTPR